MTRGGYLFAAAVAADQSAADRFFLMPYGRNSNAREYGGIAADRGLTANGSSCLFAAMVRILAAFLISLSLFAPRAFADDRLDAREIRQVVPGNWSGSYKKASLVLSIAADGTVKGSYAGIPARGHWTTKRTHDGDRICLTFSAIISDTKCGELFRKGNSVIYGYLNHGKPRLWLRRS